MFVLLFLVKIYIWIKKLKYEFNHWFYNLRHQKEAMKSFNEMSK